MYGFLFWIGSTSNKEFNQPLITHKLKTVNQQKKQQYETLAKR